MCEQEIIGENLYFTINYYIQLQNRTEVRFASVLSGGFTTMAVINQPKRKLAKYTSVHCIVIS